MKSRMLVCAAVTIGSVAMVGCMKKVASAPPPPPPSPAATTSSAREATPSSTPARTPARSVETARNTPPRTPDAATRAQIQDLLNRIQDAYFDYDKHTLRGDAQTALRSDAQTLAEIIKQYPDFKLTIEGHCDERGSEEYNLALGDARGKQAKEYLATLGLPADQLIKPVDTGQSVCNLADNVASER